MANANEKAPEPTPHEMPDYVQGLPAEQRSKLDLLLKMDDEYLAKKDAMRAEIRKLEAAFEQEAQGLLAQRKSLLGEAQLPGFWRRALINSHVEQFVEETDHDALDCLEDISYERLPGELKGYKLDFHFKENPFFENKILTLNFHTERTSKWDADPEFKEVKATVIDWKKGKDLTHTEKQKGKGKKKKMVKAPQPSFFWLFFDLKEGGKLPPSFEEDDEDDDFDEDEMMEDKLEEAFNFGEVVSTLVVPHAARHFTGEVVPEESDDEDEESDDEDDEDDDDDDDDESEEVPKKGKKGGYARMR